MSAQASSLDTFGVRLGQLMVALKLSQGEFSRRIGASPAFVSDMVRGVKKPGTEFLHKLVEAYGVGLDWLVMGKGTMFGLTEIDAELFRSVLMRMELARLAMQDGDPHARAVMDVLLGSAPSIEPPDDGGGVLLRERLAQAQGQCDEAINLYNRHVGITDRDACYRELLRAAGALYGKPADPLAELVAGKSAGDNVLRAGDSVGSVSQINIGGEVRNAGVRYREK